MTQMRSLNIDDIVRELALGKATVKFMLERFLDLIPHERVNGRLCVRLAALPILIRIKDMMDEGLIPSQIHERLNAPSPQAVDTATSSKSPEEPDGKMIGDVRMSRDALAFIQSLFQDIKAHQNRIAMAHEKRAEAEERKAVAIEKRAEAEAQKAEAMNNIAAALQEMNRTRSADAQTLEIAGQAAQALTLNEIDPLEVQDSEDMPQTPFGEEVIDLDTRLDETDLEDLFEHLAIDVPPEHESDLEALDSVDLAQDFEALTAPRFPGDTTESPVHSDIDDLRLLIDADSDPTEPDELGSLLDDAAPLPDLDDLSVLVEDAVGADASEEEGDWGIDDLTSLVSDEVPANPDNLYALIDQAPDLDDLYALVDETPDLDDLNALIDEAPEPDLDDLNLLINPAATLEGAPPGFRDMDDLSLLVDMPYRAPSSDLDDLSALIDDDAGKTQPATEQSDLDDLSLLVDEPATPNASAPDDMDDLNALISEDETEPTSAQPSLKPDITPEQDLARYKAAVMKIIIDLKQQGLSSAETTERLNRDEVPTLSGRPEWSEKAINKIYGFIDSAQ